MVNLQKVITGTGVFILSYFLMLILQEIAPTLIDTVTSIVGGDVNGILWFGYILINVLATLVFPIAFIYTGLTEPEEGPTNPILNTTKAALYSLFAIAITYFTYYMTTPLSEALDYDLLKALFWIGLVLVYITNILAVPAYMIIDSRKT